MFKSVPTFPTYPTNPNSDNTSDIRSATDYYAFGWEKPGRNFSGDKYAYGMNTQLKDYDYTPGTYSAMFWEYDSRVGQRRERDPKPTVGVSDYSTFGSNPNVFDDINGDKIAFAKGVSQEFKNKYIEARAYLKLYKADFIFESLDKLPQVIYIRDSRSLTKLEKDKLDKKNSSNFFVPSLNTIFWNPSIAMITDQEYYSSPSEILSHEGDHALAFNLNLNLYRILCKQDLDDYDNKEERRVIMGSEHKVAQLLGKTNWSNQTRYNHNKLFTLINTHSVSKDVLGYGNKNLGLPRSPENKNIPKGGHHKDQNNRWVNKKGKAV